MGIRIKKREPGVRIDPGVFNAVITGVEEGHHDKHGDFLIWKFKITDDVFKDGEELEDETVISGFTSMKWSSSKKNKLNKLLIATGVDVDDVEIDEDFDVEDIVGQGLRIVVEDDEKEDATYSKVASFMGMKKKKKKKKEEASEEDDEKPKKKKKKEEKEEEGNDEDDEKPKKKKKKEEDDDGDSSDDDDLFNFGD